MTEKPLCSNKHAEGSEDKQKDGRAEGTTSGSSRVQSWHRSQLTVQPSHSPSQRLTVHNVTGPPGSKLGMAFEKTAPFILPKKTSTSGPGSTPLFRVQSSSRREPGAQVLSSINTELSQSSENYTTLCISSFHVHFGT